MERKLKITQTSENGVMVLHVFGRLDANWAGYLDDTLTKTIEEGHYQTQLDLSDVAFLSSAGIRTLVKQHKAFSAVSGDLSIVALSDNVKTVLDMVGLLQVFEPQKELVKSIDPVEAQTTVSNEFSLHGYHFKKDGDLKNTELVCSGDPCKLKAASFSDSDDTLLRLEKPFFCLGLGALGSDFEDCKKRYGEFVALGKHVAYYPSDGSSTPDYMSQMGNLVPEIHTLYSIGQSEAFDMGMLFTPETDSSIELNSILEAAFEASGSENISFLMVAESSGLVGANLRSAPVELAEPFVFPEVRERINFTTEPAHTKALAVVFGIACKTPSEASQAYLRPISDNCMGHIHAAVFPYMPLQKEQLQYKEVLDMLFENSEVLDVLHLLKDTREHVGLGDSLFKAGQCWLNSINF